MALADYIHEKPVIDTERLILRRWEDSDAENLYEYAKDPDVGPIAGWPAHQSIEESRDVIRNVFNGKEAYAVCLKADGKAIGAIELKLNGHTDMTDRDDECELGYWLGKPFWGQGIIPEAAKEMLRRGFEDLGMTKIWVGYYEGNTKSKRVQEKCGFHYEWKSEGVDVPSDCLPFVPEHMRIWLPLPPAITPKDSRIVMAIPQCSMESHGWRMNPE